MDLSKLAADKNMQTLFAHPKVQKLLQDPKFQDAVRQKNIFKLMANTDFQQLLKDPEIQNLARQFKLS
jgi:hypothetical protein